MSCESSAEALASEPQSFQKSRNRWGTERCAGCSCARGSAAGRFERAMIQERVRAGLARARGEGKRLGRPPIPAKLEDAIRAALAEPGRPGVRKIAARFGVDPGTVQRISRPFVGVVYAVLGTSLRPV